MNGMRGRQVLPLVAVLLILTGALSPALALVQVGSAAPPTQAQVTALIDVAQQSRTYAYSTVNSASSHGLAVASAQAKLSQGDALLSEAQTDARQGNASACVEAAEAAMRDYTSAAVSASVALRGAGLTASVDYAAAVSAIADVNATVAIMSSAASRACSGAATASSSLPTQACAKVNAQIAAASMHLAQAASLAVQTTGGESAGVGYSMILNLTETARAEIGATESELSTIAPYSYPQRAQAYLVAFVDPVSSRANATIQAEQGIQSQLVQLQSSFAAYARSQSVAAGGAASSSSDLAAAISSVDTGAVSSNVSASQNIAASVASNMGALLNIQALLALTGVVTDIRTAQTATTTYAAAVGAAGIESGNYSGVQLTAFSTYLGVMNSDEATVMSSGTAYASAFDQVVADLSGLTATIPQVQVIYASLTTLRVSGSVSSLDGALQQETTDMGVVNSDVSSFLTAVSSSSKSILLPASFVSTASSLSAEGGPYLNSSGTSAMSRAASSMAATSGAAAAFVTELNGTAQGSVGAFVAGSSALAGDRVTLSGDTQASASEVGNALAYLASDANLRVSAAAAGRADVSAAQLNFSELSVAAGVSALAEAVAEFQAASSTGP